MFEYYYHEIFRRTIVSFGTLFNNISIKHFNDAGVVSSVIKVPLAYGPTQKFLARLEQQPNLNSPVQMSLPRMSFEFTGLSYDSGRKLTTTQSFLTSSVEDKTDIKKAYMPVPYNMNFELGIMCKLNDDMLQIVEQILPYFQPSYNLTVDLVKTIGEKRDIPIVLENINMNDTYEGDFNTRRALIYTLNFTAKTYLFGPVLSGVSKDIIKKVSIGLVAGDSRSTNRDLTYSVEPVATTSYGDTEVATLISDIGISDTNINVNDSSSINVNSYIVLDNETMQVNRKNGNTLTVSRGFYGTVISDHVSGTNIKLISQSDNDSIAFGDDFGFTGSAF
jgi:hypothetical protein